MFECLNNLWISWQSAEEVQDGISNPPETAFENSFFHEPDFLTLVTSLMGLPYPVELHVSLSVIGFLVGPVQDQHVHPLEKAAKLVHHEQLEKEKHE